MYVDTAKNEENSKIGGSVLTVELMNPKMSQQHPDLPAEQAYIDHAYACLEKSRTDAWRIRDLNEANTGGTFQARYERNAFDEQLLQRLTTLDLGDAALVFGRIDRFAETPEEIESFHIGRLAVADEAREPVVAGTSCRTVLPRNWSRNDGSCSPSSLFSARARVARN